MELELGPPVDFSLDDEYTLTEPEDYNFVHEHLSKRGPIELSLIERLEYSISNARQADEPSENKDYGPSLELDNSYLTGRRELLHLEGWLKESGIYRRYLFEFLSKIIISIIAFYSIIYSKNKHWEYLSGYFCAVCLLHISKSLYFIKKSSQKVSNLKIKAILLLELFYFTSYLFIFIAYSIFFYTKKNTYLLIVSTIPLFIFSFYLLRLKHEKFSYTVK